MNDKSGPKIAFILALGMFAGTVTDDAANARSLFRNHFNGTARHHGLTRQAHRQPDRAQPAYAPGWTIGSIFGGFQATQTAGGGGTVVFNVSAGRVQFGGETFGAGSGNGECFNRPSPECVRMKDHGPVPLGDYPLAPHRIFFGKPSWIVLNTPHNRTGILLHWDIPYAGQKGPSKGCVGIQDYERFLRVANRIRPTRLLVLE